MHHIAERDHVLAQASVARHHHTFADAHALKHGGVTAEEHVVPDFTVAADHRIVGEDHVIADMTIMPDMRTDHHETVVADRGDAAAVLGPGVDGNILADLAARADRQPRRSAAVVYRLRCRAERSERIDRRAWPDRSVAGDVHMRGELAPMADGDVRAYHAIRTDLDIGFDHRAWRYPGGGIDREHSQASISMAPTSASATSSPATLASPRYHHMVLRRVFRVM